MEKVISFINWKIYMKYFPGGSVVKNPSVNAGDSGLIPGSGRHLGEGNGNPLHYSGLESPMKKGLVGYSSWDRKVLGTA